MRHRENPKIIELREGIKRYNQLLRYHGLYDHQVKSISLGRTRALVNLTLRLLTLLLFGVFALPGLLLNIPALFCIDLISKRAAAKAKAGSVVKIEGRDVLATWKLMVGILLFPLLYLAYSTLLVYELRIHGYEQHLLLIGTLFTLLVFPFLSYVSLLASEMGLDSFMSILPIFFSFLHPGDGLILRRIRHTLRRTINALVDELGPKTFEDFESRRIIPRRKLSDTEGVAAFRASQSSLDSIRPGSSGVYDALGSVGAWISQVRPQEPDVSSANPADSYQLPHDPAGDWSHLSENEIDEVFFQTLQSQ